MLKCCTSILQKLGQNSFKLGCGSFYPQNHIVSRYSSFSGFTNGLEFNSYLLQKHTTLKKIQRNSTIFVSVPPTQIWEGVTGPKGSVKKRARGKRRVTRPKIDLNRGQMLGKGKAGIQWPVLNAQMDRDDLNIKPRKGEVDDEYFENLNQMRNKSAIKRKRMKLSPLQRGWSGAKMGGQSIGSPHKNYQEFDCRILQMKVVATMTATKGRFRRYSVMIGTGNGKGIIGIGTAKSTSMRSAVNRARDRAFKNLMAYNLKEGRTLFHMGYVSQWHTKIFAVPKMEGNGLVCHRLLATLCRLVGIKDMYAKVEGNVRNYNMVVQGFLKLLRDQQTYQEIADSLNMHVVEFSRDRDMYPHVLASPQSTNLIERIQDSLEQGIQNVEITPSGELVKQVKRKIITHPNERPILMTSKPVERVKFKPPEEASVFLDDLVDHVDDDATEDIKTLLAEGERDLDTLLVFKGRVPLIKPNRKPFYWNLPGNIKVKEEKYRYRNHERAKREREAYRDLDAQFNSPA